jgi:hypothetical protein
MSDTHGITIGSTAAERIRDQRLLAGKVTHLRHEAIMDTSLPPNTLLVGKAEAQILGGIARVNLADTTVSKEMILDGSMQYMGMQVLGVSMPSWLAVAYCTTDPTT